MTIERINEILSPYRLKLVIDRLYNYDSGKYRYEAYFEYYNTKKNKWGIEHVLGKFSCRNYGIDAAVKWLRVNKYF